MKIETINQNKAKVN